MSERRFNRRSSSRQSIKDCIDAKNNITTFDNISFKTGPSFYLFHYVDTFSDSLKAFYLKEARPICTYLQIAVGEDTYPRR